MNLRSITRFALTAAAALSLQGCGCEAACAGFVTFTRSFPLNPETDASYTVRACRNDRCDIGSVRQQDACSSCPPGHAACESTCAESKAFACSFDVAQRGTCGFDLRQGRATLSLELPSPGSAADGDRWRVELVEDGTGEHVLFVERDVTYGHFAVCGMECTGATL